MPEKGQILTNPLNGDSYEFLVTAEETQGDHLSLKATIRSKGELVSNHFHLLQDETFEVISGQLTIWADGEIKTLTAGEKLLLPKNKAHNHYNSGDDAVEYIHTVTPALDFEYLMETLVGLAADGKTKNGKMNLIQQLVILKYLDSKSYLADIPVNVQKLLMNIIAPIGRRLGYRAVYKKYSDIEK